MLKKHSAKIALFVLFVLPLALYFSFRNLTTPKFNRIPFQYSVEGSDTLWHELAAFKAYDIYKDSISENFLEDKVSIISLFSLEQTLISKVLIGNLRRVYDNAEEAAFINILSLHMGEHESLAKYIDSVDVDTKRWWIGQMEKEDAFALAKNLGLQETIAKRFQSEDFTTQTVALLDKLGKVRDYYTITDLAEVKRLNEDLRGLIVMEYPEELKE